MFWKAISSELNFTALVEQGTYLLTDRTGK